MSHTPANGVLRVGTRGSALAQAQTASVVQALRERYPDFCIETIVIRTSGDRQQREVVGAFVKELQDALLQNRIDVAVHSLKDLPTQRVAGLTVAAIPPRADARDVLVSRGESFSTLPENSRVGAGSLRRSAQLRWHRRDLQYLPLVGNVDTRIRRLREGAYDAIVLAAAGLQRLGFLEMPEDTSLTTPEGVELSLYLFDTEHILPAPGQGALALECRENDIPTIELLQPLDHLPSRRAVTAERALLHALGGGCRVPIAAYAEVQGERLILNALVADSDGHELVRDVITGNAAEAQMLGVALAEQLLARGASRLLGD
ncbi:MAG: porphobilinogen deaminase [Armatimonadota bacterium]|nr:MAG: porphobilinogen deaminase [Armatimonadota bacterium]